MRVPSSFLPLLPACHLESLRTRLREQLATDAGLSLDSFCDEVVI